MSELMGRKTGVGFERVVRRRGGDNPVNQGEDGAGEEHCACDGDGGEDSKDSTADVLN